MKQGRFVSFEGIEGCGKTTQIALLSDVLAKRSIPHSVTREPGGTAVGEGIRKILLHSETIHLTAAAELLLFYASRSQNILEKIEPSLEKGEMVICDRFYHASMAYQGYGRGIPIDLIEKLTDLVCGNGGLKSRSFSTLSRRLDCRALVRATASEAKTRVDSRWRRFPSTHEFETDISNWPLESRIESG
jgi:thymidylate kinase